MIIDLRYHIASLAAVFLALGVGILIGGTMLKADALVESRGQIADRLEKQLAQLRRDNEAMQAQVNYLQISSDRQKDFAGQVLPLLVKGRLQGCRVAVIETGSHGFHGDLITALELAGAKVQSVTTIVRGIGEGEGREAPEGKPGGKNCGAEQLNSRLAYEIGHCLVTNGNRAVLDDLAEANVLRLSGEYGAPLDAVVLFGGSRDRETAGPQVIDLPLIDYFQARNIPVFGVEEADVPYSHMKHYRKKGISTVDNIDTAPGQVALVLAMAGRQGHYGIKPTAQRLLPPLDGPVEVFEHAGG